MIKEQFTPVNEIVTIPSPTLGLEQFRDITAKNVQEIFSFDEKDINKYYSLQQFLTNDDHGAEHVYNVYKKADEIAHIIEKQTGEKIDHPLLYVMVALHDSGRFIMEAPVDGESTTEVDRKAKKIKKADGKHEFFGTAQLRSAVLNLEKKGIYLDPVIIEKIREYVYNHDYMTPELNGERFHEPSSLEGQIARLADRISTPAVPELERYRATGKRFKTPFFNKNISFEDRKNFTFGQMGKYMKAGKLDQFMFFATLLAVKSKDFKHPVLQELYKERIPQKKEAIDRILSLAVEEHIDEETIQAIKETLKQYGEIYEFDF